MTTELHATLEKHFDALEAPENDAPADTAHAQPATADTPAADTAPQAPAAPTDKPAVERTAEPAVAKVADTPPIDKPADDKPAEPDVKAPTSWTPLVREQWSALPADVRKEIARREDEINRAMIQVTQDRKFAQEFGAITKRYEGALNGVTPAEAYESTLKYAQRLGGSDATDQAKAIVELIDLYGVDSDALAQALTGTPAQPRPSAVEQENARLKSELSQLRQPPQDVDPVVKQAADDLRAFASKNEFYNDVSVTMGHLMTAAASQGFEMDLAAAYEQACRVVPSVKAVLDRRAINTNQQRAAASVSVKSSPSGTTIKSTGNPNASLREQLEANWDKFAPAT